MDFLTNHYKYKCEILQEQIKILEQRYKELLESEAPASVFRGTGQGQQAFGDQELESQMRRFKKGGLFQQVKDEDQTQEYRDAKAELDRRRASNQSSNTTSTPEASPTTAAPTLLQRVPGQPDAGWNRPRTTPMPPNQPPHPMDLSKSSKPRKTTQSGNRPPNLIARDPDMPAVAGIDVEGPPSPIDRPSSKPTEQPRSGPNSPDINAERDLLRTDWARGEMEKMGVPTKRERFDAVASANDLSSKIRGLLDAMDKKEKAAKSSSAPKQNTSTTPPTEAPAKPTGNSTQQSLATAVNSVVSGAGDENPLGPRRVQRTADPKVSTYQPGGFAEKPSSTEGIGKIQLVSSPGASPEQAEQEMGDWGKRRLEAEVGFPTMSNARKRELEADFRRRNFSGSNPNVRITPKDVSYKAPTTPFDAMKKYRQEEQEMINRVNQQRGTNISGMQYAAAPAVAGVDVEGPPSDLKDLPAQTGNNSIVSQLMKAFGDAGNALFDLPRQVSTVGEKIQKRR